MLDAVCCRLLAVCSVRALKSWLPRAISRDAIEMLCVAWRRSPIVDCSDSASRWSECSRLPCGADGISTVKWPLASAASATLATAGSPPKTFMAVRLIQTVNPMQAATQTLVNKAVSEAPTTR